MFSTIDDFLCQHLTWVIIIVDDYIKSMNFVVKDLSIHDFHCWLLLLVVIFIGDDFHNQWFYVTMVSTSDDFHFW
jgi:hypothetical protein